MTSTRTLIAICAAVLLTLAGCYGDKNKDNTPTAGAGGAGGAVQMQTHNLFIHVDRRADGNVAALEGANIHLHMLDDADNGEHNHDHGAPDLMTNAAGDALGMIETDHRYVLTVTADGFLEGQRIIDASAGEAHVSLILTPAHTTEFELGDEPVTVELGETAMGGEGIFTLIIEPGDLALNNGEGDAAQGTISATMGSWNPATDDARAFPSNLNWNDPRGDVDGDGELDDTLTSFGMFSIDFTQNGEPVNVAPGQTVTWKLQVPDALRDLASADAAVDNLKAYTLNHNSGLWEEYATPLVDFDAETGVVTAEAEHFSHVNCDAPFPHPGGTCVNVRVVDFTGQDVPAEVQIDGNTYNRGGCFNLNCSWLGGQNPVPVTVTARRNVGGQWNEETVNVTASCAESTTVSCGGGGCVDATITICNEQGGACNDRSECCGGLACMGGTCQPCQATPGQSCGTSNECCHEFDCQDNQCLTP